MMETSILEDLGFSKGESKTYLAMLELGETKVGQIIEKSGMASSAVHNSVNSLIDKGFVSYIKKGKIKFYQAVPPKQLVYFIEDRRKRILEILPELESKQKKSMEKQEAEIFEGLKGVMAMLNLQIEDVKKVDEYLFFAVTAGKEGGYEENKEIQDFFVQYDVKRKAKGLVVKGLAPKEIKDLFVKRKILKMKYTDFPIPSNTSICNDKIAFFSWGEKPIGYLIKSKQISEMYRDFFNKIWKKNN